jgi:hypothetical protein
VALLTRRSLADDRGVALIVTLMTMTLILAIGLALTLTTITEARIAGNYRRAAQARYAADAAIERVVPELAGVLRWDDVLAGVVKSTFTDGASSGVRLLPGGGRLDLAEATNLVRCGKTVCSAADAVASTDDRPWGANNPMWQPYAYGLLDGLATSALDVPIYVIVWVGDDPGEDDGDPLHDGGPPTGCNPETDPRCADGSAGRGVILLLARAFGADGTQRTATATLARERNAEGKPVDDRPNGHVVSWREGR